MDLILLLLLFLGFCYLIFIMIKKELAVIALTNASLKVLYKLDSCKIERCVAYEDTEKELEK